MVRDITVQGKDIVQQDGLISNDTGKPGTLGYGRIGGGSAGGRGQVARYRCGGTCQEMALKELPAPEPHTDDALVTQLAGVSLHQTGKFQFGHTRTEDFCGMGSQLV
jgi:hypothetical protein